VHDAVWRSGQSIHGGVKLGRCWEARHDRIWWHRIPRSANVGRERGLTGGAHMSVGGEREGAEDRRRESKRKAYSGEYAKGWANWAGEGRQPVEEVGPHGERGGRERPVAGWAKKAEWPAGLI
jgi:hypothetical protein